MVRHAIGHAQPEKVPQGQTVATAPGNPTLRVDPLEVAHQQHAEVDPRWYRRTPLRLGVVRRTLRLGESIERRLRQQRVQPRVEGMPRERGKLVVATHIPCSRSPRRPSAIATLPRGALYITRRNGRTYRATFSTGC